MFESLSVLGRSSIFPGLLELLNFLKILKAGKLSGHVDGDKRTLMIHFFIGREEKFAAEGLKLLEK